MITKGKKYNKKIHAKDFNFLKLTSEEIRKKESTGLYRRGFNNIQKELKLLDQLSRIRRTYRLTKSNLFDCCSSLIFDMENKEWQNLDKLKVLISQNREIDDALQKLFVQLKILRELAIECYGQYHEEILTDWELYSSRLEYCEGRRGAPLFKYRPIMLEIERLAVDLTYSEVKMFWIEELIDYMAFLEEIEGYNYTQKITKILWKTTYIGSINIKELAVDLSLLYFRASDIAPTINGERNTLSPVDQVWTNWIKSVEQQNNLKQTFLSKIDKDTNA